jgi:hypothetical protein
MEPFIVLVREGSPFLPEKMQVGMQELEIQRHDPRHGTRKVVPPRYLPSFMIFYFPEI